MKEITIYIADDGKKFDNEGDCLKYEAQKAAEMYKDTAFIFDKGGKPLPLTHYAFEKAHYIKAVTDAAASYMKDLANGWETPWDEEEPKAGKWACIDEGWHSIEELKDMLEILEGI